MIQQGPPSGSQPKRLNAFIGLYDLPIYRDWAAWMTLAWAAIAALALGTGKPSDSGMPRWADVLLGTVLFPLLFGVLPAWARLGGRKLLARRGRKRPTGSWLGQAESGYAPPPPSTPQPFAQAAWPMPGRPAPEPTLTSSHPPDVEQMHPQSSSPLSQPAPEQHPAPSSASDQRQPAPTSPSAEANEPEVRPAADDFRSRPRDGVDYVKRGDSERQPKVPRRGGPKSSARPVRPTPLSSLQPTGLAQSEALVTARSNLQYPMARAARAIQLASNLKDEYEQILAAGEAVAITLGVTIAATIGPNASDVPAFSDLKRALVSQGASQGHWISLIAATDAIAAKGEEPLAGLRAALRLGPRGSGLVADLRSLVEERNRWAHGGGPRTSVEAGLRLADLATPVERIFDRCAFLSESPWILTRTSSFRRASGDFEVSASEAMGDHPEFEHRHFVSQLPLADETFYLLSSSGPVDLTPFVVMRYCETCRQPELCYADRLDRRDGVALKSFARGHNLFDHTLDDELRRLWDRDPETGVGSA